MEAKTIEITVVRQDGYWAVLNKDLLVIGSVRDVVVNAYECGSIASQQDICNKRWIEWSRKLPSLLKQRSQRQTMVDEWCKKIAAWQSSLKRRHAPKASKKRRFSGRNTWSSAVNRMAQKTAYQQKRKELHDQDRWQLWCESSGSALAKRYKTRLNNNGFTTAIIA